MRRRAGGSTRLRGSRQLLGLTGWARGEAERLPARPTFKGLSSRACAARARGRWSERENKSNVRSARRDARVSDAELPVLADGRRAVTPVTAVVAGLVVRQSARVAGARDPFGASRRKVCSTLGCGVPAVRESGPGPRACAATCPASRSRACEKQDRDSPRKPARPSHR